MIVMEQRTTAGGWRRCDSRCHNAKGKKCRCLCLGRNHGKATDPDQTRIDFEETVNTKQAGEPMEGKPGFLTGNWQTRRVFMDGRELLPERSQQIRNHSPDGFNWGYGGSGPSQLALAVLLELIEPEIAVSVYQDFKWTVIAGLPQADFELPVSAINRWLQERSLLAVEQ